MPPQAREEAGRAQPPELVMAAMLLRGGRDDDHVGTGVGPGRAGRPGAGAGAGRGFGALGRQGGS